MTKGLPGSGKSTWAREEVVLQALAGRKAEVICKDDIRRGLTQTGWEWSPEREADVLRIRDVSIRGAFERGKDVVIVADTNFGRHEARLRQIAGECKAQFEVKDFTHVPVSECIERDDKRTGNDKVGPQVIKEMFNKYIAVQEIKPYVPDIYATKAIICDLDGTVALHQNRRSPFDYSKVDKDAVNWPVADIVKLHAEAGFHILYVSGREDSCRDLTLKWLTEKGLPSTGNVKLFMRKSKDHRKDSIVKLEIFDEHIRNQYRVMFVLDDRDQVVKMWRELGLTCLQVAEGAF